MLRLLLILLLVCITDCYPFYKLLRTRNEGAKFAAQQSSKCYTSPTIAAVGDSCEDANTFCSHDIKKKDLDLDYELSFPSLAVTSCVNNVCLEMFSIDHGESCTDDIYCKSADCTSSSCKTPLTKPTSEGDTCDGVCFGDGLECKNKQCAVAPKFATKGDVCQLITIDKAKICDPSENIYCDGSECVDKLGEGDENCALLTPCANNLYCRQDTKVCTAYLGEGEECGTNQICKLGELLCTSGTCSKPEVPETPPSPPCPVGRKTLGGACTNPLVNIQIGAWPCSCDDEWVICNDGEWTKRWSLEVDATATTADACRGDLWWNKDTKKCVDSLECTTTADCRAGMDSDADADADRLVYCDCDSKKCAFHSDVSWKCSADEVQNIAKDICPLPATYWVDSALVDALGTSIAAALLGSDSASEAAEKVLKASEKAGQAFAHVSSKLVQCVSGDLGISAPSESSDGDSDGATAAGPHMMIVLMSLMGSIFFLCLQ